MNRRSSKTGGLSVLPRRVESILQTSYPPKVMMVIFIILCPSFADILEACSDEDRLSAICDPLRENPALRANIEFELEAILSVQVVSQLNSDYCTNVSQWGCTVSC